MRRRVIAIGSSTGRNRVGRVYSLWLTARAAGLEFRYVTLEDGPMWEPLREHEEFLADVRTAPDLADVERQVADAAGPDAIVMVCKPRPELVRLGRKLAGSLPVVVDVDDPELLDPWGDASLLLRAKRVVRLGPSRVRFRWAHRAVRTMNVVTSNPLLQDVYGGGLVPHVREVAAGPTRRPPRSAPFVVGFIGTVREHKGIRELRTAVATLARRREVRLRLTAPPPADAFPWEDWVGPTTLERGRELLESCHAVAIVSRPGVWGDLQLPVKLVDAMASGIPAVTTARPPMLWAAGGSTIVVRDDGVDDMAAAFSLLAEDPDLANALGAAAWRRACSTFTPAAAAPALVDAIERSEAEHRRRAG